MTYIIVLAIIVVLFIIFYKIFKFIVSLILILAFLLLAYVTNPSLEMHRHAVVEKAKKEKVSLRRKRVERENYYIFSLTKVTEGEDHTLVGAAAFTQVFIFSKP